MAFRKGEAIEEKAREKSEAESPWSKMGRGPPPKPEISEPEQQRLFERSQMETEKTKAHLDEFFSKPRTFNKAASYRR
jgi:hypothetical protein